MPRQLGANACRSTGLPIISSSMISTSSNQSDPNTLSAHTCESDRDFTDGVHTIAANMAGCQESAVNMFTKWRNKGMIHGSKSFPFLELASELRMEIYKYYFVGVGQVIDLDPENRRKIHSKMGIMRVCRTMYREATHIFYSIHCFRIFPTYPLRFFRTKRPLLARLTSHQRASITSLELRLGPGWGKPPRGWVVSPALGLADCITVKTLLVFIECDPSDAVFNGFRKSDGFYEDFSRHLLLDILQEMPWIECIYFEANSSVKRTGDMMLKLLEATRNHPKKIYWFGEEMDR